MTVLNNLIRTIEEDIDHMEHALNPRGFSVLVGDNYVIRTSPGLYLRLNGQELSYAVGIMRCNRFSECTAKRIAPSVRDGNRNYGQAVLLVDALREELEREREALEQLKDFAANQK